MQVEYNVNECIVEMIEGDITDLAVDAIVNAEIYQHR